ncbi:MAG: major facilitator superfamily domain-containing protein [Benniella sp.]|nr:MAG: major facilitator superfamily domain-containing protein [Benniella sp.]
MPPPSSAVQEHYELVSAQPRSVPCRYWIILLCGLGLVISYADRSNMSVAIVAISQEHGYTKSQQGLILASFFFGYILTPILGGALADRYGGKHVLGFAGLMWSVFTLLTPLASSMGLVWIVLARIALGLGEGFAYPSVHAMIGTWIPPAERSKAVATVTGFAYMGTVVALPTSSALVVSSWGWRSVFWLFGILGLIWSAVWQIFGASEPASCYWITEQELRWILTQQQLDQDGAPATYQSLATSTALENETPVASRPLGDHQSEFQSSMLSSPRRTSDENLLGSRTDTTGAHSTQFADSQPSRWQAFRNQVRSQASRHRRHETKRANKEPVPWKALLARREVWAIILSQLFNSFGFFVMQSWAPTFYLDYYGVDVGKIGFYSVLPSAVQGIVGLIAGYLGDKAVQDWNWTTLRVRRVSQAVGSLGLGAFLMITVFVADTAALAMALITIGMALNGFTLIGASAYQHDFCPQYAGFIFSLGNTAGSTPALIGVFLVGKLLEGGAGRWVMIWLIVCLFYVVGTTAFVLLSTNRKFPHTITAR